MHGLLTSFSWCLVCFTSFRFQNSGGMSCRLMSSMEGWSSEFGNVCAAVLGHLDSSILLTARAPSRCRSVRHTRTEETHLPMAGDSPPGAGASYTAAGGRHRDISETKGRMELLFVLHGSDIRLRIDNESGRRRATGTIQGAPRWPCLCEQPSIDHAVRADTHRARVLLPSPKSPPDLTGSGS
jgi:hypothetical protein